VTPELANALRSSVDELEAELRASTELRHRLGGMSAPAAEAAHVCQQASYIVAASLHNYTCALMETAQLAGFEERAAYAAAIIRAALDWWKSYEIEAVLVAASSDREQLRSILTDLGIEWDENMSAAELARIMGRSARELRRR
jgi:hypothetical protein